MRWLSLKIKWKVSWASVVRWEAGGRRSCWPTSWLPPPLTTWSPPPGRWWAPCPPAWQAAGTAWSATTLPTGGFPSQCPSTSGPGRSLSLLPTRWSTRSSTSRGSSEGPRHLKVTVRSSTTSAGLFVKKKKETFEDSFQRYSNFIHFCRDFEGCL